MVPIRLYEGAGHEIHLYRSDLPGWMIEKFIRCLMTKIGRGYDYGQIFSIGLERITGWKIKAQNKQLAICSEIIYESAKEAGIKVPEISQAYITPGDFENWSILRKVG